jgi:hypothetical protein
MAYRKLMTDLAKALATDSTQIDRDVNDMYRFETAIAQVHLFFTFEPNTQIVCIIGVLDNC